MGYSRPGRGPSVAAFPMCFIRFALLVGPMLFYVAVRPAIKALNDVSVSAARCQKDPEMQPFKGGTVLDLDDEAEKVCLA